MTFGAAQRDGPACDVSEGPTLRNYPQPNNEGRSLAPTVHKLTQDLVFFAAKASTERHYCVVWPRPPALLSLGTYARMPVTRPHHCEIRRQNREPCSTSPSWGCDAGSVRGGKGAGRYGRDAEGAPAVEFGLRVSEGRERFTGALSSNARRRGALTAQGPGARGLGGGLGATQNSPTQPSWAPGRTERIRPPERACTLTWLKVALYTPESRTP